MDTVTSYMMEGRGAYWKQCSGMGGEGAASRDKVKAFSAADRNTLVKYLESL